VLSCTTIFLVLSIVETAYRNFFRERRPHFQKTDNTWSYEPHKVLGVQINKTGVLSDTKFTRSGSTIYHASYTLTTDSIGSYSFNHRIGFQNPSAPSPKVVFLGCSFTFGQGVNDSETLPYRVGALCNSSTLNLGSIGYGLHQVYKIFLDEFAYANNNGRLFVYTMIPDHVLRASGLYDWSPGPSFQLAGDSLIYSGSLPSINYQAAYYCSLFGCFTFIQDMIINIQDKQRAKRVSPQEYEKAFMMIRKMDQYSKMSGGHFLVLFWDNISEEGDPNRYYRQILQDKLDSLGKSGIDIIKASDIFHINDPKYYIPNDGHPDAMAYDTVAKYLVKCRNLSYASIVNYPRENGWGIAGREHNILGWPKFTPTGNAKNIYDSYVFDDFIECFEHSEARSFARRLLCISGPIQDVDGQQSISY
jgi:hypothetical protein